ncbi:hypothetical protein Cgig2_022213 [Carnegiea gigantea]|uniref:Exonuclease domain-containing protein n=1 Tax=Carnegiea gigantea TaxID=171969 RepID=A0A9Q1KA25_9CARY|nr:hypothetical protein Cgig2_022213 [Carnegiea gigantea]
MASCRTSYSVPLIRRSSTLFSQIHFCTFPPSSRPVSRARCVTLSASRSIQYSSNSDPASDIFTMKRTWQPMCLYYTQGKCTMMDDRSHLDKFSHSCSEPLEANIAKSKKLHSQHVDFFLVLDLEGKVEILEFPVIVVDAKTMEVVNFFHRFVRPSNMTGHRIKEYIEGKYGKLGIDRYLSDSLKACRTVPCHCVDTVWKNHGCISSVWHDTAMPFVDVIREFEAWMALHNFWRKEHSGPLQKAAFLFMVSFTDSGNWDIKTKIPQQCRVSGMKIPPYFTEWINLKDIYLNFYHRKALGMRTMLNELQIPLLGSHHLGIDDTKNIARLLQKMLADGALIHITARRNPANPETIEFLFKNRIRYHSLRAPHHVCELQKCLNLLVTSLSRLGSLLLDLTKLIPPHPSKVAEIKPCHD